MHSNNSGWHGVCDTLQGVVLRGTLHYGTFLHTHTHTHTHTTLCVKVKVVLTSAGACARVCVCVCAYMSVWVHCACMRVCEFINNVLVVSGDVKPSLSVTPVCVVCCSLPIHQTDLYGVYRSVFSFNSHCLYMYIQDCLQTVRLQPEPPLDVYYVCVAVVRWVCS